MTPPPSDRETWKDAHLLRMSIRCMAIGHPDLAAELRAKLRKSRRYRKEWLATCRNNHLFILYVAWRHVYPSPKAAA